ncbi:putative coatomer gamma subunit protein [Cryptosporidium serpentis]
MRAFLDLKGDDKGAIVNPFIGEKSSILQETRNFNQAPLNSKKCCIILTKVLHMINSCEKLTDVEWSDLFFGITRLFQSNDEQLRRLLYLAIKSLKVNESEAFVVISSLIKDMNSSNDCYRANSLRVMSKIADYAMINQIERYLKSAIVDKNSFVASCALICGYNLSLRGYSEVPRRWLNEINECVQNRDGMVQYHAITLLFELRQNDRLATQKIVEMLFKLPVKSTYSECLMLRQMVNIFFILIKNEPLSNLGNSVTWILDCLHTTLRHRDEIVTLEAAYSICTILLNLEDQDNSRLSSMIDFNQLTNTLQMLLNSNKSVARFAAVRILNELANIKPNIVLKCQHDLEPLLTDSNRIMATLILTILLKIAQESNLERLVKQIPSFISDINDGCKKDIIKATKSLIIKYPSKHKSILTFLSSNLREEGSLDFKSYVIDVLFDIALQLPNILENILYYVCEIIEDCEYPSITIRILGFIGKYAPETSNPSRYVRYIYNRLILENSPVRAASIDSLVRIAIFCSDLSGDIRTLLQICTNDNDDEVRDRTHAYSKIIDDYCNSTSDGTDSDTYDYFEDISNNEVLQIDHLCSYLTEKLPSEPEIVVNFDSVQTAISEDIISTYNNSFIEIKQQSMESLSNNTTVNVSNLCEKLATIMVKEDLGRHMFTSIATPLTENEAEYIVHLKKHFFNEGRIIVLEFQIVNTLNEQILKDVSIEFGVIPSSNISIIGTVTIPILESNQMESVYVLLQNLQDEPIPIKINSWSCRLNYILCEYCDPDHGYNDIFTIEPINFSYNDYILPNALRFGEFKNMWDILETHGFEAIAKFAFSYKSISSAIDGLLNLANSYACDNTEDVRPEAKNHTLLFSGSYLGSFPFLGIAVIVYNIEYGCLVKITCRSKDEAVCHNVIKCFDA